jgi:hypothetical protein
MITIHKFPIAVGAGVWTDIDLPVGHVVRHVGLDPDGAVCVWIELDTEKPVLTYVAMVTGTGHEVPRAGRYTITSFAGTVVQGHIVWHVWLA